MSRKKLKGKYTIINEMVANAADVMEEKADEMDTIADQFEDKGDTRRAAEWRSDIPAIRQAVELMRAKAGCWA